MASIIRVKNHFGYSAQEDGLVTNPDCLYVKPGDNVPATYTYEKDDNVASLCNIIRNMLKVSARLQTETNQKVIKRIQEIIKNGKQCLIQNKQYLKHVSEFDATEITIINGLVGQKVL